MDILSDIFDTIQLRGALYFRTDFSPPWGTTVPAYRNAARFHLVVEGRCHVILPTTTVVLGPGDLILIPHGQTHKLADGPGADTPPLETVLAAADYTGEGAFIIGNGDCGASTRMICGHFSFAATAAHPLLGALPDHLLLTPSERARRPWLDETLRLIVNNVFSGHQGARAAIVRLSEVVFIEAIRTVGDAAPELDRMLRGFTDPHVGKALVLIHKTPAKPWTVDSLAREVAMSRSRFAESFHDLMGCGPITYLSDWRLQKAMAMLTTSPVTVGEVARRTGYNSAAAFTRAFTARFERPPSAFRRGDHAASDGAAGS